MSVDTRAIDGAPVREVTASDRRGLLRGALFAAGHASLIAVTLFVFLHGWQRDINVPLNFANDSLPALMQSKSTVDNGWWWFNPMLGAPFGLDELAFPANSNVDQGVVWLVSRFFSDAVTSTNLAWAVMVVLSGLSSAWCMRQLGMSAISALTAGTLFAVSPYALYRNIDHIWMVIYLVPFAGTVALLLATDHWPEHRRWKRSCALLLVGCALIGLDYVYYAFFASFLIGVAALVGFATHRRRRVLVAGSLCLAVVCGFTALNLAPSLYSWQKHGRPIILGDKTAAEADRYGLNIRHLVGPAFQHWFPPFRAWTEKEAAAHFPLDTENITSRLGLLGTIGFLGLLALLFVPRMANRSAHKAILEGASRLSLAAVLLGTVGGFGSLVSLLITPDIRAYNRIAPFIAFFSLVAVGLTIDALARTHRWRLVMALAVLVVGLTDQSAGAVGLNAVYAGIVAEVQPLRTFVAQLESRLPDRAMVLQLPFRSHFGDLGVARMRPYDHLKPYIVSHRIRWSYPALINEHVFWQDAAATLETDQLAVAVAAEGFVAIAVDRFGYDDNGAGIAARLSGMVGAGAVLAESERYVAFDIRSLRGAEKSGVPDLRAPPQPASPGIPACPGTTSMDIDQIGDMTGRLTGRVPHLSSQQWSKVIGWAVDHHAERRARGVDIVIGSTVFHARHGIDRPDVSAHFSRSAYLDSGFVASIPPHTVGAGPQVLRLRVLAADGQCYFESAAWPIVVD